MSIDKRLDKLTGKIVRVSEGSMPSELAAVCSRLIVMSIYTSTNDVSTQNRRLDALIEFMRDDLQSLNKRLH